MSRKNHKMIDGKLLRTDKNFSHLKSSQVTKINEWMQNAYNAFRDENGHVLVKRKLISSLLAYMSKYRKRTFGYLIMR